MAALEERDALRGARVEVHDATGAGAVTGTALGISPDGALLVRTGEGVLRRVQSGTVLPAGGGAPVFPAAGAGE
jgi:biotin-(acetyl-CoA carboxylase) ligase